VLQGHAQLVEAASDRDAPSSDAGDKRHQPV